MSDISIIGAGTDYYDAAAGPNKYRAFVDFQTSAEDHFFDSRSRQIAIGRIRREIRNNPYLSGLYASFPGAIGASTARARTVDPDYNDQRDLHYYRWAKSPFTSGDSMRRYQLLRHAEMLAAGELFLIKLSNGKSQMITSEFCGSPLQPKNPREINGIIYDEQDRPVAYRFGRMERYGTITYDDGRSVIVPAEHVNHDYRKDRILMGRGLPWLMSSLAPARDLYEITVSKTKQVKDAARLLGYLKRGQGGSALDRLGDPLEPEVDPANAPVRKTKQIQMRDGTFVELDPGDELHLLQQHYQASDYKELIMILLHAISAPVGLPVELWFSGLGNVNFSGFKGLATQWNRRRRDIISDYTEHTLDPLYEWQWRRSVAAGVDAPPPDDDYHMVEHAWPRTAVLDSEREAKTNKTTLESGESSLGDVWEERGQYSEEELAKRRRLWIQMLIASGELSKDEDSSSVRVPVEFLLRGKYPGEKDSVQKLIDTESTNNQEP